MSEKVHQHRHFIPAMGQDRLTPVYDLFTRMAGVPAMHRYLIDRTSITPQLSVLEIGCGTGNLVLMAKRRYPTATVIGIDPDDKALGNAERKATRRRLDVRFEQAYADALPFPDASLDRVLSSLMFHHLDSDGKIGALREARRVLRPGGELHLLDFTDGGAHRKRIPDRFTEIAGDKIPELMREAGFTGVERTGEVSARFHLGRCVTFRAIRPDDSGRA